jgi:hypothetical protein
MRALKICLWIAGVGCLLSVFGMFLPVSWLESLTRVFGGQEFPDSPMCLYAVRLMSGTYAAVGLFFVILALHPMKYGVMVPFSGIASVFVGVVCGITGPVAEMPVLWYLGDSVSCTVVGVLILVFWRQAKQSSAASTGS